MAGIIVLATLSIYSLSLPGPFLLDDLVKIADNPDIRRWDAVASRLVYPYAAGEQRTAARNDPSRPLVSFSYALNYHFGKTDPRGYRMVNVIFHLLNALCVLFLSRKLFRYLFERDVPVVAFFTAFVFAVHPANTYTVNYVFCRSDLMATFFFLSALLLFIRAVEGNRKLLPLSLSLICFVLALLSKQVAITLPAVLLLTDLVIISGFELRRVKEKLPYHLWFWGLGALYVTLRYIYFGAVGDAEAHSTFDRITYLSMQPYSIMRYAQFLLVPAGLCFFHDIYFLPPATIIASLVLLGVAGALGGCLFLFRRTARATKVVWFSGLWFAVALSPTSSIFPTTNILVENRMYLPGVGFSVAAGALGYLLYRAMALRVRPGRLLAAVAALGYLWLLSLVSLGQNSLYANHFLLWKDAIAKYPGSYVAHGELGALYARVGKTGEAKKEYLTATALSPGYYFAHRNLGLLYLGLGEYEKAVRSYHTAHRVGPYSAGTLNNLAVAYYALGKYDKAGAHFAKALAMDPQFSKARNNLDVMRRGKPLQQHSETMQIE